VVEIVAIPTAIANRSTHRLERLICGVFDGTSITKISNKVDFK
jgi:hypothetical protein